VEVVAVDAAARRGVVGLGGRLPAEAGATPERVEHALHALELVGIDARPALQPGAVLAILTLELPVVAGVTRWAVKDVDAVLSQESKNGRCVMRFGAVETVDQGRAVTVHVVAKDPDRGPFVHGRFELHRRAQRQRRVRDHKELLGFAADPDVHLVQATDHARHGYGHASCGCLAFTLHRGERRALDGCRLASRDVPKAAPQRLGTDQSAQRADVLSDRGMQHGAWLPDGAWSPSSRKRLSHRTSVPPPAHCSRMAVDSGCASRPAQSCPAHLTRLPKAYVRVAL